MIFAVASSTGHTGLWGDGHQGLSDGLLPALSHLHADSWGGQSGTVVVTAVVLPYIVDHGGCDDLKAVWVAALGQITVVFGLFHLEDLGERDFLWEWWGTEIIKTNKTQNIIFCVSHKNRIQNIYQVRAQAFLFPFSIFLHSTECFLHSQPIHLRHKQRLGVKNKQTTLLNTKQCKIHTYSTTFLPRCHLHLLYT